MDWFFDDGAEKPMYELRCTHPDYPQLRVSIASDAVTERAARARLIELAFAKAKELGIDETCLRFHV